MAASQSAHWISLKVKKVIRYLLGNQYFGLSLLRASDFSLTGSCDADWSGDVVDRKSHTSFFIYIGNTLILWKSKKQSTVMRSSTESEY